MNTFYKNKVHRLQLLWQWSDEQVRLLKFFKRSVPESRIGVANPMSKLANRMSAGWLEKYQLMILGWLSGFCFVFVFFGFSVDRNKQTRGSARWIIIVDGIKFDFNFYVQSNDFFLVCVFGPLFYIVFVKCGRGKRTLTRNSKVYQNIRQHTDGYFVV